MTSLRRFKNISKKMSFAWRLWNVSSISQKRCLSSDISKTSQKQLSQVFVIFQKYPTKMVSCHFRRVIRISDKTDVGPLETLKKWSVFWEHCIDINKPAMNISGLISAWEFWQFSDRHTLIVGVLFTTFSDFFRLIRLYITRCHYELWWNTEISTKLDKKLRSYILR